MAKTCRPGSRYFFLGLNTPSPDTTEEYVQRKKICDTQLHTCECESSTNTLKQMKTTILCTVVAFLLMLPQILPPDYSVSLKHSPLYVRRKGEVQCTTNHANNWGILDATDLFR